MSKQDLDFLVDARPVKEGKDPLSEGNTLVVAGDKHYELLESSEDVRKAEKLLPKRDSRSSHPQNVQVNMPKVRSVKNKSKEEIAEVIKKSKRTGR